MPFKVKTAHGTSCHDDAIYVEIPDVFKAPIKHVFYKFDFSKNFDGLIGIDLLQKLNAVLDIRRRKLITENTQIPIHFRDNRVVLNALESKPVRIPVNQLDGIAYVEEREFIPNVKIRDSVVNIVNGEALVMLTNYTTEKVGLIFYDKMEVNHLEDIQTPYNFETDMEIDSEMSEEELSNLLKENVTKHLNTKGMTLEEKGSIRILLERYKHIFHVEGQRLSFTHCIKHKLNLKNDTPIYVKMYRQSQDTKKEIKKQIFELLDQDIIKESITLELPCKYRYNN